MHRTRTGKRIELTARDLQIFRLLAAYRYLPSTYLHAFAGGASVTRFKERLGDLFHEGYLDRPERQWEMADCRHRPAVHELGDEGRRVLAEYGGSDGAEAWLGSSVHRQFAHALMICTTVASIELGTLSLPNLRFIPWHEVLAKAPESTRAASLPLRLALDPDGRSCVVPDAVFGLEYLAGGQKRYRFFALEADRGTMPVVRSDARQTSYLAKLASYRDLIARGVHRSHLGVSTLFVLTVATSPQRLSEMLRRFGERGDGASFLFKSIAPDATRCSTPIADLLATPWERANATALRIDRAE